MPKLKTSKSALKRIVKITGTGKFLRYKMSAQHRAKGKSKRTRKEAQNELEFFKGDAKKLKKLVPYR